MPKRVFTPAAIKIIRDFAAQERSAVEIAEVIGSTAASVRVKCSQIKIRLSRRGRRGPTLVPTLPDQLERKKLVNYMDPAHYAALKQQSDHMQKPAGELAGMLLQAVVSSDIYKAVLDDDA
jgi:hypothetical protein